jgi:site-specific recombinase XerD
LFRGDARAHRGSRTATATNDDLPLFDVRRAHLKIFDRHMEADGRMRSTFARRLSTLGSFYWYRYVEGVLERNPAANVRRPRSMSSHEAG